MSRLINILQTFFVSFEFLAVIVTTGLWYFDFFLFTFVGNLIKTDEEIWKFLLTLPSGLLIGCFACSYNIRSPGDSNNKTLFKWPGYVEFVDSIYVAQFIAFTSFLAAICVLLLRKSITDLSLAAIFIGAIVVSAICLYTLLEARQKVKEILESQ